MVSAGLATIASCNNDLVDAIYGKKTIRILCIGHGGGSLPLFLATKIQGRKRPFPWCMFLCCDFFNSGTSLSVMVIMNHESTTQNHFPD